MTDDRVYVTAAHTSGFKLFGALYCLNRVDGEIRWTFHRDQQMKQSMTTPALDSGRLYVGEGLHEDSACRLFCLDALSRPAVAPGAEAGDGTLFIGAGVHYSISSAAMVYCVKVPNRIP